MVVVVALVLAKALIIYAIIRILGSPQRVAVMAGIGLAQIGEFSFVLAKSGQGAGLLHESD